jgi:putative acetyltransferase
VTSMSTVLIVVPQYDEAEALCRGFERKGLAFEAMKVGVLPCTSVPSLELIVAMLAATARHSSECRRYPEEGANHFRLDDEEVAEGRGAFLVCYSSGQPVACGAIRRLDPETAEIKRMFVEPSMRGLGIGSQLVTRLEAEARRLGVKRVVLETGVRQPEALALYERAGFARVLPFGEYARSPLSVCMAKELRLGRLGLAPEKERSRAHRNLDLRRIQPD